MGLHTIQYEPAEIYTPVIVFNDCGEPSWCGKTIEELSAADLINILLFCKNEGYRKGWNDSNNDRVAEDCDIPFHEKLFDGFPYAEWKRGYQHGVYEHRQRFYLK